MKTITTTTTLSRTITITYLLTTKATTPPYVSKVTQNFATVTPTYPATLLESTKPTGKK